jgi:acyl carrier protein
VTAQKNQIETLKEILTRMNVYPHVQRLTDDENLFTAGVMDSLILIQFVLAVEDEFKIRLKNEDVSYEQFQSLEKIASLLKTKYDVNV